jgi:hypothetical protein
VKGTVHAQSLVVVGHEFRGHHAAGNASLSRPIVVPHGPERLNWRDAGTGLDFIPQEFVPYIKDATEVTFYVPQNARPHAVLFTDSGFNGKGEKVIWQETNPTTIVDGRIPVTIAVRVRIDTSRMEKALGDGTVLPVETRVNGGVTTDAYVVDGTERDTNVFVTVQTSVVGGP